MSNNFTLSSPQSGQIVFVPAQPGWYAIQPIYEDAGTPMHELVRCPIIAWKIETVTSVDGSTFETTDAITVELLRNHECLESPAGHFYLLGVTDYATEQEVLAYYNRREDEGAKRVPKRGVLARR